MQIANSKFFTLHFASCILIEAWTSASQAHAEHYDKIIRLSLTSSKPAYSNGEPVELSLTVTNVTKEPVTLTFRSAKQYDFLIKKDGQELWRWSEGKMFAMVLTHLKLNPEETKIFRVVWPQTDKTNHQVNPGSYEAVGILPVSGNALSVSAPLKIE